MRKTTKRLFRFGFLLESEPDAALSKYDSKLSVESQNLRKANSGLPDHVRTRGDRRADINRPVPNQSGLPQGLADCRGKWLRHNRDLGLQASEGTKAK